MNTLIDCPDTLKDAALLNTTRKPPDHTFRCFTIFLANMNHIKNLLSDNLHS